MSSVHKARRNAIRNLIADGAYEEALQRANEWGFIIGAGGKVMPAPLQTNPPLASHPVQPNPVTEPPEPVAEPPLWPSEGLVVVVHRPLNNRMLGVELSDGRRVNLWKTGGRTYPIGAKLRARLYEMVGPEPYYEAVGS